MNDDLRKEILKPELREDRIDVSEIEGNYIFRNGTWWHIETVGLRRLVLKECTAQEAATKIIGHPGIVILEAKQS